jgi:GNAT superfamily N-acetyltransferase
MADATIDRINPTDVGTITHLYNSIFRPERDAAWIERRLEGRHHLMVAVASNENDAVGFYVGYEVKPNTHQGWLLGVVPDMRRTGIGSQLLEAAAEWARTEGYHYFRFESPSRSHPIIHLALENGFDITGTRWDPDMLTMLVTLEKPISDQ